MGVDHINGDGLDNRSSNLRLPTAAQNRRTRRIQTETTNPYKVINRRQNGVWEARIRHNGRDVHLGTYNQAINAVPAYDAGARLYHGEFARLNFPELAVLNISLADLEPLRSRLSAPRLRRRPRPAPLTSGPAASSGACSAPPSAGSSAPAAPLSPPLALWPASGESSAYDADRAA
jgi:hypothetical protein